MADLTVINARALELEELLLSSTDLTDFLQQFVAGTAAALAEGAEDLWCSITVLRGSTAATVATSHERAAALDEVQYAFDGGPCLTAAEEQRLVLLADSRSDDRWPPYARAAAGTGIRSVLAAPFDLDGEARAALNVYSESLRQFDPTTVAAIEREVALASRAMRLAVRLARHHDTEADMGAAMQSRSTIDLAVGIVMGRQGCTHGEAVELLKSLSTRRNIKLRELAAELVTRANNGPVTAHFNPSTPPATGGAVA
jgi:hypothetical protein